MPGVGFRHAHPGAKQSIIRFPETSANFPTHVHLDQRELFQIERAEGYYARAFAALPAEDRKNQRPGIIMAGIYEALLKEIKADGCHVLRQRVRLTPMRKLWIAWTTWMRG